MREGGWEGGEGGREGGRLVTLQHRPTIFTNGRQIAREKNSNS